ncbi:movement protein [Dragonfly-associated mastrevirus]|uniref:Movement protein n=1 Tax=Dragonfly-associated mastrevirus TaxID=1249648 RepID=K7S1S4_9GEMI|nr:movement protein [Dragonfly-associated mastrevirus]YP_010782924.1 movement protein [Dragonfly-associated mastrevirus]AFV91328.1 movement protein [Dragonfly-associated mastrevirus]AFV91332.1 movement protein [Dragonfly-associated mastrevirus]
MSYQPPYGDTSFEGGESGVKANPVGIGNDSAWRTLALAFTVTAVTLGLLFGAWKLCVKDCLLTLRAKRSRTTTELGFGNTPQRPGVNQVAPVIA